MRTGTPLPLRTAAWRRGPSPSRTSYLLAYELIEAEGAREEQLGERLLGLLATVRGDLVGEPSQRLGDFRQTGTQAVNLLGHECRRILDHTGSLFPVNERSKRANARAKEPSPTCKRASNASKAPRTDRPACCGHAGRATWTNVLRLYRNRFALFGGRFSRSALMMSRHRSTGSTSSAAAR